MVAQNLDEFLTEIFLTKTEKALKEDGFVSDEHEFAPYRETISTHWKAINEALLARGNTFELLPGYINHAQAGYAYYLSDQNRFDSKKALEDAITKWLDSKYEAIP